MTEVVVVVLRRGDEARLVDRGRAALRTRCERWRVEDGDDRRLVALG